MRVLVDTSVWSLALRRKGAPQSGLARRELASLIGDGRAEIIGPIRQEILSGIRETAQFETLEGYLRAFVDIPLTSADFVQAAAFFNECRSAGVQGSNTDFLICAVAMRNQFSIFTTDRDFEHFAKVLPLELHRSQR